MVRVEIDKWGQTLEDLRLASVQAAHRRSRERFQALDLIAAGQFKATTCAAHIGRHDETVLGWVRRYNEHGPDALTCRRTGGRAPLLTSPGLNGSSMSSRELSRRARPARLRLDAEEAHAVGVPGLRPARRSQQSPAGPAAGEADVEE